MISREDAHHLPALRRILHRKIEAETGIDLAGGDDRTAQVMPNEQRVNLLGIDLVSPSAMPVQRRHTHNRRLYGWTLQYPARTTNALESASAVATATAMWIMPASFHY